MKHKGTITLETERLILRRFTSDAAEVFLLPGPAVRDEFFVLGITSFLLE